MGDSRDLQLRNVVVSHTALFQSIQAGAVGPPGTTECGRERKSLILIALALEEHPRAPSVRTMPACKVWSKVEPLLEDNHETDVPQHTLTAPFEGFWK